MRNIIRCWSPQLNVGNFIFFLFILKIVFYFQNFSHPVLPPNSPMYPSPVFFKSMASFFNCSYFVLIVINIHTLLSVVSLSRHWFHFTLLVFAAVTGIVLTTENLELRVTNKNKQTNMWCLFFWVCDTSLNMMLSTSTYLSAKFMILFFIMAK